MCKNPSIWHAILYWRRHIYQSNFLKTTKSTYLYFMNVLIKENIIDINYDLKLLSNVWLNFHLDKINKLHKRNGYKTVLKSFYIFAVKCKKINKKFYEKIPKSNEAKIFLSRTEEKYKIKNIDSRKLYETLNRLNPRDAKIVFTAIDSEKDVREILKYKSKNGNYLFQSSKGKKIYPSQIVRNLKLASKLMKLDFNIYPSFLKDWKKINTKPYTPSAGGYY